MNHYFYMIMRRPLCWDNPRHGVSYNSYTDINKVDCPDCLKRYAYIIEPEVD